MWQVCKMLHVPVVCMNSRICVLRWGHVVLFKQPRWWLVINEWVRESGSNDSWLVREGGNRGRERWMCVSRRVCVLESEQDKARQSGGRGDGKSLRIDKEQAWGDEGKTMGRERRVIVRDCGSVGVEQYLDQRWRHFVCCQLFFLSSLAPTLLPFFCLSEVTLQSSRNMATPWAGLKLHKTQGVCVSVWRWVTFSGKKDGRSLETVQI